MESVDFECLEDENICLLTYMLRYNGKKQSRTEKKFCSQKYLNLISSLCNKHENIITPVLANMLQHLIAYTNGQCLQCCS